MCVYMYIHTRTHTSIHIHEEKNISIFSFLFHVYFIGLISLSMPISKHELPQNGMSSLRYYIIWKFPANLSFKVFKNKAFLQQCKIERIITFKTNSY